MTKGIILQRFFYNEQYLKMLYIVRGASLMILKSNDNDDDDDNGNTKKRTQAVYVIKGANWQLCWPLVFHILCVL